MNLSYPTKSILIAGITLCGLPAAVVHAQFDLPGRSQPQVQSAADVSSVRVTVDRDVIGPGDKFNLLVMFDTQPHWHVYWKNPGEGAASPDIRVTAPEGFEVDDIRWPRPKIVNSPIGDLYCYEGRTALFVPVTAPSRLDEGEASFTFDIGYAVCDSEKCFFGRSSLSTKVKTSSRSSGDAAEPTSASLERYRKRLPVFVDEVDSASAELAGSGDSRVLTISGPAHGFEQAVFLPYVSQGVRYGKPSITFENDRFTATMELSVNAANFTRGTPKVGGLIGLGKDLEDPSYEVEFSLEARQERAAD